MNEAMIPKMDSRTAPSTSAVTIILGPPILLGHDGHDYIINASRGQIAPMLVRFWESVKKNYACRLFEEIGMRSSMREDNGIFLAKIVN
jgi:hypothetical protein